MGGDNIIIPNIIVMHEGDKMKVKSLEIKGIGGIKELSLEFNDGLNVICGANGIGKTTILNVIADAFSFNNERVIKRNARCNKGSYDLNVVTQDGELKLRHNDVTVISPESNDNNVAGYHDSHNLMNFNIKRDIPYMKLNSIPRDVERREFEMGRMAVSGINADDIKGWLENRCLFSKEEDSLSKEFLKNLELSKSIFGILDDSVKYYTLDSRSLDIILRTKNGDIYFEYLSSGYKTCIYVILGIIREIEFRYPEDPIYAGDFTGVVLIDEVDMHLHPTWQARLVRALKDIFPKIQFIMTTHSPSILQSLSKDEIIALGLDENGNTFVKELNLGEYGLQGWTLEEILQDVMGMPSTTSDIFQETMVAFDKAMMEENVEEIKKNYELLDKMLHPNSTQRKLLQIQMVGLEE